MASQSHSLVGNQKAIDANQVGYGGGGGGGGGVVVVIGVVIGGGGGDGIFLLSSFSCFCVNSLVINQKSIDANQVSVGWVAEGGIYLLLLVVFDLRLRLRLILGVGAFVSVSISSSSSSPLLALVLLRNFLRYTPTELILGFFLFQKYFNYTPPPPSEFTPPESAEPLHIRRSRIGALYIPAQNQINVGYKLM